MQAKHSDFWTPHSAHTQQSPLYALTGRICICNYSTWTVRGFLYTGRRAVRLVALEGVRIKLSVVFARTYCSSSRWFKEWMFL